MRPDDPGAFSGPASGEPPHDPPRPERPGPTIDDDPRWTAVSTDLPCPVCGATTGRCGVAVDEELVDCQNVPSEHPIEGGGWLHPLPPRRGR